MPQFFTMSRVLSVPDMRRKVSLEPILLEFGSLEALVLWVPILSHLLASFSILSVRGTWEIQQAARILEHIALSAADVQDPESCIVVVMQPPGDWKNELSGAKGLVSLLRDMIARRSVVLRASDVAMTHRWLAAALEAVYSALASVSPNHSSLPRGSIIARIHGFIDAARRVLSGSTSETFDSACAICCLPLPEHCPAGGPSQRMATLMEPRTPLLHSSEELVG